MADPNPTQWQVTCQCGWRTHGTQEEVVRTVRDHGRAAHQLEITDEQVMGLAVPMDASAL